MWKKTAAVFSAALLFAAPLHAQNTPSPQHPVAKADKAKGQVLTAAQKKELLRDVDKTFAKNPVLMELKKIDPKLYQQFIRQARQKVTALLKQEQVSEGELMYMAQTELQPLMTAKMQQLLPYADDDALKNYTESLVAVLDFLLEQPDSGACFGSAHGQMLSADASQEDVQKFISVSHVMMLANMKVLRQHNLQRKLPDKEQIADKLASIWAELATKYPSAQHREWFGLMADDGINMQSPVAQQRFFCEVTRDAYRQALSAGDMDVVRYLLK